MDGMADPVEIGSPWAGCREAINDAWCFHSVGRGGGGRRRRSSTLTKATATMASLFSASKAAPRARAAGGGGCHHLRLRMPARAIAITPGGTTTSHPRRTAMTPARAIATPPGQTTMSRTPSQDKRVDPIARAAGGGGHCHLRLCTPARALAIAPGGTTMLRPHQTAMAPARVIATPPGRTTRSRTPSQDKRADTLGG